MKHQVPVQLRFNDTDALGHVNNSTYFSFYDLGKSEYFATVRGNDNFFSQKIDIVVAHVEVDFIEPIFLTDRIAVETGVSHIGTKSLILSQQIVDLRTGQIKCKGSTTMVGFDFDKNITIPISQEWRDAIEKYEERKF